MRLFSNFSGVCLLFSLWYFPANGQIGGTQHYGNRVILMGKWYQAGYNLLIIINSKKYQQINKKIRQKFYFGKKHIEREYQNL